MGFIGDFYDEVADAVKKGADSVQTTVGNAEQERIIRKMSAEIGNLVLVELDNGRDFGPAIMERYEAILAARKIIEANKGEKKPSVKICPACGKANALDMKYCGYCAADMDVVPEPAPEETEAPAEDTAAEQPDSEQ